MWLLLSCICFSIDFTLYCCTIMYPLNICNSIYGPFYSLQQDDYQFYINCVVYNELEVTTALRSMNWDKEFKITAIPASLIVIVEKTLGELELKFKKVPLQIYQQVRNHAMPTNTICPDEFVVRTLCISDATIINDTWYSRQNGSIDFFRNLIEYNICLGIYRKDNNELVAWCTRCPCGFLGTLHVREVYRRHGLASVLINEFSKRVAQQGDSVRTMIYDGNEISKKLFLKHGFQSEETVFIVRCETKNVQH
ncbi:uncharacterized protein isoform X2 [Musca autumnalis]|uniref:uncharacterized protein isoform X2 n=1 Tax=Musca autumnalis TaxID=221902 RepID=UPI003CEFAC97